MQGTWVRSLVGERRSHKQAKSKKFKKKKQHLSSHSEVFPRRILAWQGRQVRGLGKMGPGKSTAAPSTPHCRELQGGEDPGLSPASGGPLRPLLVPRLQGSRFQSCRAAAAGSLQLPSWVGSPPRAGGNPQRAMSASGSAVETPVSGGLTDSTRQRPSGGHRRTPELGPGGWVGRELPRLLRTGPPAPHPT